MAFRVKGSSSAPAASPRVAQVPQTSMVGKRAPALSRVGGAPKPMTSRRDYGKTAPAAGAAPAMTPPNPFGPSSGGI